MSHAARGLELSRERKERGSARICSRVVGGAGHGRIGSCFFRIIWATILGYSSAINIASAGQAAPPAPPKAPAAHGVYVDDSFEASDAVSRAQRLAAARQWTQAAELLQHTMDTAGDKLVHLGDGRYRGVRKHITDLIADWPTEGLEAYRQLYDRDMRALMSEAELTAALEDDLAALDRFFCTTSAAESAEQVALRAIESGDLSTADRLLERLLAMRSTAAPSAARYRALRAVLAAMGGALVPPLTDEEAGVRLRWMGEERPAADILAVLRESPFRLRPLPRGDDWPVFGGASDRSRRSVSRVDELGLLWRISPAVFAPPRQREGSREGPPGEQRDDASLMSIQPVTQGDSIFLQRGREVFAVHRNTGAVVWRYPSSGATFPTTSDSDESASTWEAVTVHEGRVYAAIPGDREPYYGYESTPIAPELVCLDMATGALLWRLGQEQIGESFAQVHFDPSPIVERNALWAIARRRRTFGFEDAYVYRVNATTGTIDFRTHVGSASTGSFGNRRPTIALAALHGDSLFVATNLGTVAAVTAATGAVRWLRVYPRDATEATSSAWSMRSVPSWAHNPVYVWNGRLVVRPLDAAQVFIIEPEDGALTQVLEASDLYGVTTILGVRDGLLCGAGERVFCWDLAAGTPAWDAPLPEGGLWGRGAWADDRLLIPARSALSVYAQRDGTRRDLLWDAEGHGGNLLALPEQLVVAGGRGLAVFVRKTELWASLRARLAAAPHDPVPALEFAEVALRGGDDAMALEQLDDAFARAGGLLETVEVSLKRRFFDDVLLFAETMAARSALRPADLSRLHDYAARCPPDAAAHLRYRLRFGELFERYSLPEDALRLYQQILRDRTLRDMGTGGDVAGPGAGVVAQQRVTKLLEQHGSVIYVPYEVEAQRWLDAAWAARDPAGLARVVEAFPNSSAATKALGAQGEVLVAAGRFEEAARQLARAYQRTTDAGQRAELMRRIAEAYAQAGRGVPAYRWLTRAAREFSTLRIDVNGRRLTFREYRDELADLRGEVEPQRPRLEPPLSTRLSQPYVEGSQLLEPWFAEAPRSDGSRVYVYTPDGLRALAARTNVELWAEPLAVRAAAELLLATPRRAVFTTSHELFAVDVRAGARLWTHGGYPRGLGDPEGDWENGGAFRTHAWQDDTLVSVRDTGDMSALSLDTGEVRWTRAQRPLPAGRVIVADPWVVFHVIQDGRPMLCYLDIATGEWLGALPLEEPRTLEEFFVAVDGQVVTVTAQSIAAYDLEGGTRRWRVALEAPLRMSSLLPDIDALYFSEDGRSVRKISLEDGRTLWRSEPLGTPGEGLTIQRERESVIASHTGAVAAFAETSGATLWHAITPEDANFTRRLLTDAYVVALHVPDEGDEPAQAYLYTHREGSGRIAVPGGRIDLGRLSDLRAVRIADDALLIQDGGTIHTWTRE